MDPSQNARKRRSTGRTGFWASLNFWNISRNQRELALRICIQFKNLMSKHLNHIWQMRNAWKRYVEWNKGSVSDDNILQQQNASLVTDSLNSTEKAIMELRDKAGEIVKDIRGGSSSEPTVYFTKDEVSVLVTELSKMLVQTNSYCESVAIRLGRITGIDLSPTLKTKLHTTLDGHQLWIDKYRQGYIGADWANNNSGAVDSDSANVMEKEFAEALQRRERTV